MTSSTNQPPQNGSTAHRQRENGEESPHLLDVAIREVGETKQRCGEMEQIAEGNGQLLRELQQTINREAGRVSALRDEFAGRDARIFALSEGLARAEAAQAAQTLANDAGLLDRDTRIAALVEKLARADTAQAVRESALETALNLRDLRITALFEGLAERDNRFNALDLGLSQGEGRLAAVEEAVARLGSELAEHSAAQKARAATVDDELLWRDQRLAALNDALAELGVRHGESLTSRDARMTAFEAALAETSRSLLEAASARAAGGGVLESDVALHRERLAEIEREITRWSGELHRISALEEGLSRLEAASAHAAGDGVLESDVALHRERLAEIEREMTRWSGELHRISAVEEGLSLQAAHLAGIEHSAATWSATAARVEVLGDALTQLSAELRERASAFDEAFSLRDHQLQRVEAALANAGAANEELRQAISHRAVRGTAAERDLAVQSERLAAVEQRIVQATSQSASFPPSLDLLPRLARKDFVLDTGSAIGVSASTPTGHFLFGPYLTIEPGIFTLEFLCRAGAVGDRNLPVLTVEIATEARIIGRQAVLAEALEGPMRIAFEVTAADRDRDAQIEFRFSHHGNANIEILAVRLHAVSGISPTPIHSAESARRSWWSRWFTPRGAA